MQVPSTCYWCKHQLCTMLIYCYLVQNLSFVMCSYASFVWGMVLSTQVIITVLLYVWAGGGHYSWKDSFHNMWLLSHWSENIRYFLNLPINKLGNCSIFLSVITSVSNSTRKPKWNPSTLYPNTKHIWQHRQHTLFIKDKYFNASIVELLLYTKKRQTELFKMNEKHYKYYVQIKI